MTMKRNRLVDQREVEALAMANCLMLLSRVGDHTSTSTTSLDREFECKTCNRKFHSFQALGGHRAGHKRPKLIMTMGDLSGHLPSSPAKPKTHECSICGLEFAIGQALGGHMRRHRSDMKDEGVEHKFVHNSALPVLKKSNSKRVMCLDLNLTPYENDLKLGYQMAPLLRGLF